MKIIKLLFVSLLLSNLAACQPEDTKDTENKDKTNSTQSITAVADGNKDKKDDKKKDSDHKKNDKKQDSKNNQPKKSTRPPEPYKELNVAQTKEMLSKATGAVLIDARNAKDFKEGHMDQAQNLDFRNKESFNKQLQSLDKSKSYIIYAYKGKRSKRAAKAMAKAGFKNLYIVDANANELLGQAEKSKK